MSGRFRMSEGDWICDDNDCQNVNFARRLKCNKCGKDKPFVSNGGPFVKKAHEVGEKFAEKSHGLFSADDWQCSKCGNVNWARRSTCNVCNAPKVGPEEIRTGYGGGFKENDNISYKEKEDSDGEYDEFGRKKKHLRGQIPYVKSVIDSPNKEKEDFEKRSFKDQKDDNEDDEDDEDEDGGVDVSAYDLSESDDEEIPKSTDISKKPLKRSAELYKDESKKIRKDLDDNE